MNTFYLDGSRSDSVLVSYEITAPDMQDALRQIAAFNAGISFGGLVLSVERLSTKPTRGVKYVRGW